MPMKSDQD